MTEKYVKLSDVKDVLEKAGLVTAYYDDGYESISGYDAYNVDEGLAEIHTADVEPVRHAHWERLDKPKCKRDWYRCTNCGRVCSRDYDDEQSISEMLPYCNCGARMEDEVRKDG